MHQDALLVHSVAMVGLHLTCPVIWAPLHRSPVKFRAALHPLVLVLWHVYLLHSSPSSLGWVELDRWLNSCTECLMSLFRQSFPFWCRYLLAPLKVELAQVMSARRLCPLSFSAFVFGFLLLFISWTTQACAGLNVSIVWTHCQQQQVCVVLQVQAKESG